MQNDTRERPLSDKALHRLMSQCQASVACKIGRHDECTERGFRKRTEPFCSNSDASLCRCVCRHPPSPGMVEADLMASVLGWRPFRSVGAECRCPGVRR